MADIADDIPEAGVVSTFLRFDIFQHHLEGFQIGVNVGNNRELHLKLSYYFETAKPTQGFAPT